MTMHPRRRTVVVVAAFGLWASGAWAQDRVPATGESTRAERLFCEDKLHGELWSRTELYFGLSRSDGPNISEEEFQHFLDTVVTPRFPDGLTLLSGNGQFRGSSGIVIREPSKLLILFFPWSNAKHRAIEKIRTIYKNSFHQEAVLRSDAVSCVSF
jgi:hypothetical protein